MQPPLLPARAAPTHQNSAADSDNANETVTHVLTFGKFLNIITKLF